MIYKDIKAMTTYADSRTASILINLNLDVNSKLIANKYVSSKADIEQTQKGVNKKTYKNLRSTLRECYLTGSLRYGNNFVM